MNALGKKIKDLRYGKGWTRRQLADETGFTESAIYAIERGAWSPSDRFIRALEKAFGEQLRK